MNTPAKLPNQGTNAMRQHLSLAFLMGFAVVSGQVEAADPAWNYTDQNWGALTSSATPPPSNYPYAECTIGTTQTPVDIGTTKTERILNGLTVNWQPFPGDYFNTGYGIQVQPYAGDLNAGTLKIGKDSYDLIQLHVHEPAEHAVNGALYSAEMHFVHARVDGRLAVLGVFVTLANASNSEFQKILDNMPNTPGVKTHNKSSVVINLKKLLPNGNGRFFTYSGSLTTPPCSAGVGWYIYETPLAISPGQYDQLKSFYFGNNRQLQPLNTRTLVKNK